MFRCALSSLPIALVAIAAGLFGADRQVTYRVLANMHRFGAPVGIVEGAPGILYFKAGTNREAILSIQHSGSKTVLGTFKITQHVLAPLVTAANGRLYSAIQGGPNAAKVFSVDSKADSKRVYSAQTLFPAFTQNLPDTTLLGVAYELPGSIYDLVTSDLKGNVTSIYRFPSGERLQKSAIVATDGNYYGISNNTSDQSGYVFQVSRAGALNKLLIFPAGSLALSHAFVPLLQARDGNLYGATTAGGDHDFGSIYQLTLTGQYKLLHSFTKDDAHPGALIEGSDGNLYGATYGSGGHTTLFRVTTDGEYTSIYHMNPGIDGQCECLLTQGSDGVIYGTAISGGTSGNGVIFSLNAGLPKPAPRVRHFHPQSGGVGTKVRIWGYNLLAATVEFNGVPASHVFNSGPNYVWATVPAGATTGPLKIRTKGGATHTRASFTVSQ